MRRRVFSTVTVALALITLGAVLYSATLVDRRPPAVTSIRLSATAGDDPVVGQAVTAVDIRFSEPVRTATVESRFLIVPSVAGALSWHGQTAMIFTPSDRLPPDTEFTISLAPGFEDLAGNAADVGIEAWAFRTIGPPRIAAAVPEDGATGVPIDTLLTLRFDRLMDTEAVERAVHVEPAVGMRYAWSGQDLSLQFDAPLRFGTTYTVSVGRAAADTSGSPMSAQYVTRFTTVPAGLRVEGLVPADGIAGISVRTPIAIVFDGPIDPASIAGSLEITPSIDGALTVAELPGDGEPRTQGEQGVGRVLLFTPSSPLAANTTYSLTLDPVIRRLDGEDVAEGRSWAFTTGQPTASGQNQIAFLSARSGIRNVWLMNPDGSNPRQLTSELAPVSGFDASGDGSRVTWAAAGFVRVMQIDGSDLRTLTGNDRFEYAPRFAPDGRSLLLGRRDASGEDLGYWLVPLPGVLDIDERRILDAGAPPIGSWLLGGDGIAATDGTSTWSPRAAFDPRGEQLLLVTADGDVRHVDLTVRGDQGAPAVTGTGLVATAAPAWSGSLRAFVVVARQGTAAETLLWVVGDSGTARSLSAAAGSVAASPTGLVAFLVREPGGPAHLAVASASGALPARLLTSGRDLDDRWPAFGPGGETIVFGRLPAVGGERSTGIWLVDVASGQLARLSTDGSYPRWLP
jgi:hypothetical protein